VLSPCLTPCSFAVHRPGTMEEVFSSYCGPGNSGMDGKTFAKLCKDTGLINKTFTPTDADLVFSKAVEKGQRRITFEAFERALGFVANKKGMDPSQVAEAITSSKGPVLTGTRADNVRFHDDKSTYTGVHVNGGPDAPAKGPGRAPASGMHLRPDAADAGAGAGSGSSRTPRSAALQSVWPALSSPRTAAGPTPPGGTSPRPAQQRSAGAQPAARPAAQAPQRAQAAGGSVKATFDAYSAGQPGMDGKSFVKLCKDCHLMDKAFTATDADLIFAKAAGKGARRIDVAQLHQALEQVAAKKHIGVAEVEAAVSASGGPVLAGTQADAVRFHDDKSTYTGVHVNGGPESVAVGAGSATQLASAGMRMGQ